MRKIDLYFFTFSTYLLIIGIAFIIGFIIFYKISKKYNKVDVIYVYIINILGFAIGSKIFSLIFNEDKINLYNFANSGYSFIGGIIGSDFLVILYCKKYKLETASLIQNFAVIYPIIYAISKIGCFLNGCCYGIIKINNSIYKFPLQLIDLIIMFGLFLILMIMHYKKKKKIFSTFLFMFGFIRFLEDFFRYYRNVIFLNFTLTQIVCILFMIIGLRFLYKKY